MESATATLPNGSLFEDRYEIEGELGSGSFGRVYIGGEERDVVVAHEAATQAIKAVTGKVKKK